MLEPHVHNNLDSPLVDMSSQLFTPYRVTSATTAPTDTPPDGTLRFLTDGTNYRLWLRINKGWHFLTLT